MVGFFFNCFVHASNFFFFFFSLAQLVAMKQQLKVAQVAAAGNPDEDRIRIERPDNCTNIQKVMGLWNNYDLYGTITVSPLFFLVKCIVTESCIL